MTRLLGLCALLFFGCAGDCPVSDPPPTDLVIEQIRTRSPSIGEATLLVGPDGTSVLIDVANDAHDKAVREALLTHVGTLQVDWVVLTHYHADHIGGFDALFDPNGKDPVSVTRGVVVRGGHIGRGPGEGELEHLEATLTHPDFDAPLYSLCDEQACNGLLQGDLSDPDDDPGATFLPLEDGARLYLTHANGVLAVDGTLLDATYAGIEIDSNGDGAENARSLGGVLRYGAFDYAFSGDLTGGGGGTANVESFIAENAGPPWPEDGVDLLHLSHHGLWTSSNAAWVFWLLPSGDRNAIMGANAAYVGAPSGAVLDRVARRIGDGRIWATAVSRFGARHERLEVVRGGVVVRVLDGGDTYEITERHGDEECGVVAFQSVGGS
jgi:hypothetical protein